MENYYATSNEDDDDENVLTISDYLISRELFLTLVEMNDMFFT